MFKKFIAAAAAATLLASSAMAADLTSIEDIQQLLYYHAPVEFFGKTVTVELSGTILDLYQVNGSAWEMIVTDPTSDSWGATRYNDEPVFSVYFFIDTETPPFSVGDTVNVLGSLNFMTSSYEVPAILVNGFGSRIDH